jgi:hypothetical protein
MWRIMADESPVTAPAGDQPERATEPTVSEKKSEDVTIVDAYRQACLPT